MPLFRKEQPRTAPAPVLTINGRPQLAPEGPSAAERRTRLFVECERRLADDPLTQQAARGQLLGDGNGLEGLAGRIAPLFECEQSLVRWVALRAAFTHLHMFVFAPDDSGRRATRSPEELADVMGLTWKDNSGQVWSAGSAGEPQLAVADAHNAAPAQQRDVALAIAQMSVTFATSYPRIAQLPMQEVPGDGMCSALNDVIALDCIAWTATALLRLGLSQLLFSKVPEPDALVGPGWYTEPVFAKFERYWDGTDWTSSVRQQNGRQLVEGTVSLR
jgi:hypothetical protein